MHEGHFELFHRNNDPVLLNRLLLLSAIKENIIITIGNKRVQYDNCTLTIINNEHQTRARGFS